MKSRYAFNYVRRTARGPILGTNTYSLHGMVISVTRLQIFRKASYRGRKMSQERELTYKCKDPNHYPFIIKKLRSTKWENEYLKDNKI